MSRRPRRHTPAFKAKVALPPSKAIEHWLSRRSSSTSHTANRTRAAQFCMMQRPLFQ